MLTGAGDQMKKLEKLANKSDFSRRLHARDAAALRSCRKML